MLLPWYIQSPQAPRPRVGARGWGVGGPGDEWTQGGPKGNSEYSNPDSKYTGPTAQADANKAAANAFVAKVGALYDVAVTLVAGSPGDAALVKIGVGLGGLLETAQSYAASSSHPAALESQYNTLKTQLTTWKTTHTNAPVAPPAEAPPPPVAQAPAPKPYVPPVAAPPVAAPPAPKPDALATHEAPGLGKYMNGKTAAYALGGVGVALLLSKMVKG